MRQDRPFVWKSTGNSLGRLLGGVGLRESQGGVNNVSQVDGHSDMAPACLFSEGRAP